MASSCLPTSNQINLKHEVIWSTSITRRRPRVLLELGAEIRIFQYSFLIPFNGICTGTPCKRLYDTIDRSKLCCWKQSESKNPSRHLSFLSNSHSQGFHLTSANSDATISVETMAPLNYHSSKETSVQRHIVVDHEQDEDTIPSLKRLKSLLPSEYVEPVLALSRLRSGVPSMKNRQRPAGKKSKIVPGKEEEIGFGIVSDDDDEYDYAIVSRNPPFYYGKNQRKRRRVVSRINNQQKQIKPLLMTSRQSHLGANELRPLPLPPKLPNVPFGHILPR